MRWEIFMVLLMCLSFLSACDKEPPEINETFTDYRQITYWSDESDQVSAPQQNQTIATDEIVDVSQIKKPIRIGTIHLTNTQSWSIEREIVLESLVDIFEDYDIMIVQGTGTGLELEDDYLSFEKITKKLPNHEYAAGTKQGGKWFSEAHVMYYNTEKVKFVESFDYESTDFLLHPFVSQFIISNKSITLASVKVTPQHAQEEIGNIKFLEKNMRERLPSDYYFVMGDLMANELYYDLGSELKEYYWYITDDMDTSVRATNKADNRIITPRRYEQVFCGIDFYQDDSIQERELIEFISDEYPVGCELHW